jgi:hypothetical protein
MPPRLEKLIDDHSTNARIYEIIAGVATNAYTIKDGYDMVREVERETALAAWNAALDAVREGVPGEEVVVKNGEINDYLGAKAHNRCRTAVTDHINSLGV